MGAPHRMEKTGAHGGTPLQIRFKLEGYRRPTGPSGRHPRPNGRNASHPRRRYWPGSETYCQTRPSFLIPYTLSQSRRCLRPRGCLARSLQKCHCGLHPATGVTKKRSNLDCQSRHHYTAVSQFVVFSKSNEPVLLFTTRRLRLRCKVAKQLRSAIGHTGGGASICRPWSVHLTVATHDRHDQNRPSHDYA